jgi:hypothetical protein
MRIAAWGRATDRLERPLQIVGTAYLQHGLERDRQVLRRGFGAAHLQWRNGVTGVEQNGHSRCAWNNLLQDLQSLAGQLRPDVCDARDVPARSRQASNEPRAHRVCDRDHDDWRRRGGGLRGQDRRCRRNQ